MGPPSFSGGADPLMVENRVQDIEDMITVLPCIDEKRVLFVTFKLIGEAKHLWRLARLLEEQRPNLVAMTWSRFKEIFFERYLPTTVKSEKATEFLYLTQGLMIVQQYAEKFIELFRFASYLVPDEEKKEKKFEKGLRQSLFEQGQGKRPASSDVQAESSRRPRRRQDSRGGRRQIVRDRAIQGG
ncbi:uncharacterized protein LOC131160275 [Malania oleifera]|uniref:uncharacterized protein LOC131160275 n=1 Tax=Malania oleifera TaxID=397392 RepID=UPI0025ADF7BC|nr:uncharacterized protein LOC131160275 [Malania oleifera]